MIQNICMKKIKVAINGFGRIGRLTARILIENNYNIEIVSVNDLTSAENLAYLFQHDSTYKDTKIEVSFENDYIILNKQKIKVFANKEPIDNQWKDIDVVLECTGKFLTQELAQLHIKAGAKKVILSAPAKDDTIPTFVIGCNESLIQKQPIISNASCTTNCLAPVLKIISEKINIESIMGVTVHAITATQAIQDGPSNKDFRDGRACSINLIPSKTGASKAVEIVVPRIKGKLNLSSLRAPVITGSCIYVFIVTNNEYTKEEINNILNTNKIEKIVEYSTEELVSSDIIGNNHSSIIDSKLTEVLDKQIKLVLWYDNEWGYANRLADMILL
jgi:glyceraldehyde 3-phosphate dehydrogenase